MVVLISGKFILKDAHALNVVAAAAQVVALPSFYSLCSILVAVVFPDSWKMKKNVNMTRMTNRCLSFYTRVSWENQEKFPNQRLTDDKGDC